MYIIIEFFLIIKNNDVSHAITKYLLIMYEMPNTQAILLDFYTEYRNET